MKIIINICTSLFIYDKNNFTELELHSFCDESVEVYSAAVYARSSKNNNIVTNCKIKNSAKSFGKRSIVCSG